MHFFRSTSWLSCHKQHNWDASFQWTSWQRWMARLLAKTGAFCRDSRFQSWLAQRGISWPLDLPGILFWSIALRVPQRPLLQSRLWCLHACVFLFFPLLNQVFKCLVCLLLFSSSFDKPRPRMKDWRCKCCWSSCLSMVQVYQEVSCLYNWEQRWWKSSSDTHRQWLSKNNRRTCGGPPYLTGMYLDTHPCSNFQREMGGLRTNMKPRIRVRFLVVNTMFWYAYNIDHVIFRGHEANEWGDAI